MKILLYRRRSAAPLPSVTERAAGKARRRRRALLWDAGHLVLLWAAGVLCLWYAPILGSVRWLAWLVPVNASPWELLKLLYWPTVAGALLRRAFRRERGILTTYAAALCSGMAGIVTGCYLLPGIWGVEIPFLHLFLLLLNSTYLMVSVRLGTEQQRHGDLPGAVILLLLGAGFIRFTGDPPGLGLFMA